MSRQVFIYININNGNNPTFCTWVPVSPTGSRHLKFWEMKTSINDEKSGYQGPI